MLTSVNPLDTGQFGAYICIVKKRSYKNSLILIVVTALVLISAQVYFLLKNYEANKQRFIQDVREALDASIENYFADKAKNSIYVLNNADTIVTSGKSIGNTTVIRNLDSLIQTTHDGISSVSSGFTQIWTSSDSVSNTLAIDSIIDAANRRSIKKIQLSQDSTRVKEFEFLAQKIILSISEDLIDFGVLHEEFAKELRNKNLKIQFSLRNAKAETVNDKLRASDYFSATSTSKYLGDRNSVTVDFENATLIILKNGIRELLLSVLLIGLVIGTLIHLYRTIYAQKQLAAIKDDLISNITHEFKTPIATIFSALEGVTSFNESNDREKTRRYLALSTEQLQKLNNMVEKMLETATIDQGTLRLNKEEVEVSSWTEDLVNRFKLIIGEKKITFEKTTAIHVEKLDRFHVENALSNLIDNAIKYGGEEITVRLIVGEQVTWEIEDNGGNVPAAQRDKIFEKLYRIPTGNQHDVKGFGIGLYYARTVTELHGGQLTLDATKGKTLFRLKI